MRCPTCIHPEGYDRLGGSCPTCGGDGVLPPGTWQARHVESGATVACRDRDEAEAHVRESASGPWVAAPITPPESGVACGCGCGLDGWGNCPCGCGDWKGCGHDWLDRPESDTRECLICGTEAMG